MTKLKTKLVRSLEEWQSLLPDNLRKNTMGENQKRPVLNQLNYAIVHNNLKGRGHLNPSYEELRHWIRSGQVVVDENTGE